jgi:predicted transposase/invertase (TIGR01784 family)
MRLVFPEGQEIMYTVPVMKYWEYDNKKIIEEKMYPLLPLQIFKLRYKMENIKRRNGNDENEINAAVLEAKQVAETIAREGRLLFDQGEIDGEDLNRVLVAVANLFEYLNGKYGSDKKLDEEVYAMTKTLYDPIVAEKAKIEGKIEGKIEVAKKLISLGFPIEKIAEITELPIAEIRKLLN